jgi:hypothetical protein
LESELQKVTSEHAEMMKGYSKQDLRAIARHSLSLTERARATGKWTLAEIESEELTRG